MALGALAFLAGFPQGLETGLQVPANLAYRNALAQLAQEQAKEAQQKLLEQQYGNQGTDIFFRSLPSLQLPQAPQSGGGGATFPAPATIPPATSSIAGGGANIGAGNPPPSLYAPTPQPSAAAAPSITPGETPQGQATVYRGFAENVADQMGMSPQQKAAWFATIGGESGWNPAAVSSKGAVGLGQLMPGTARDMGVDPSQWRDNLVGSARYFMQAWRKAGGDPKQATALYYSGVNSKNPTAPNYADKAAAAAGGASPQSIAQQAVATMPPRFPMGTDMIATLQQVAQHIEQIAPDAPPQAKAAALEMYSRLLSPMQKQVWDAYKFGVEQSEKQREFAVRQGDIESRDKATQAYRQDIIDLRKQAAGEQGSLEASKTLQVLDAKGNVVRTVMARERKNQAGWIDSQTGKPVELKPGETLRQITPGSATGGRAGAQVLRQQIGGREVLSDLQNAVSLPVGTTVGPLGTVQQGTSVVDAVKGDLVRTLTPQDAQLMQASMASLSRELSILMSPVYGGNWAAQQIDPLIPKSGDTLGTVMFKMARLAQSADNALEAIEKSPILSNDQQQYARELRGEIMKAVSWTPAQAMAFARKGKPGQSFSDFAKISVTNQPTGPFHVGQIIDYSGKKYRVTGGDLTHDPDIEPVK